MIQAIVFDCFGVLTSDGWLPFKQKYFGDNSESFEEVSDLNKQAGAGMLSPREFIGRVAEKAGISPDQAVREIDASNVNSELFEYIRMELKPQYKIGMLSNAGSNQLEKLFTAEQVGLFDEIALSYEMGTVKPEVRAYETIADRLGVTPQEIVFIDDQERHCSGARGVGMKTIVYQDLQQMKRELQKILG